MDQNYNLWNKLPETKDHAWPHLSGEEIVQAVDRRALLFLHSIGVYPTRQEMCQRGKVYKKAPTGNLVLTEKEVFFWDGVYAFSVESRIIGTAIHFRIHEEDALFWNGGLDG